MGSNIDQLDYDCFKQRYIQPFKKLDFCYALGRGFIVWRLGTGANVELLHIRAFEPRRGHGRKLFYRMLEQLGNRPPYYSVFGFTRVSNERAAEFYKALGFNLQSVTGLYADGEAVMFWRKYQDLLDFKHRWEASRAME